MLLNASIVSLPLCNGYGNFHPCFFKVDVEENPGDSKPAVNPVCSVEVTHVMFNPD